MNITTILITGIFILWMIVNKQYVSASIVISGVAISEAIEKVGK